MSDTSELQSDIREHGVRGAIVFHFANGDIARNTFAISPASLAAPDGWDLLRSLVEGLARNAVDALEADMMRIDAQGPEGDA